MELEKKPIGEGLSDIPFKVHWWYGKVSFADLSPFLKGEK